MRIRKLKFDREMTFPPFSGKRNYDLPRRPNFMLTAALIRLQAWRTAAEIHSSAAWQDRKIREEVIRYLIDSRAPTDSSIDRDFLPRLTAHFERVQASFAALPPEMDPGLLEMVTKREISYDEVKDYAGADGLAAIGGRVTDVSAEKIAKLLLEAP